MELQKRYKEVISFTCPKTFFTSPSMMMISRWRTRRKRRKRRKRKRRRKRMKRRLTSLIRINKYH